MSVPDRILTLKGYNLLKAASKGKPTRAYVRLLELISVLTAELKEEGIVFPKNHFDSFVN